MKPSMRSNVYTAPNKAVGGVYGHIQHIMEVAQVPRRNSRFLRLERVRRTLYRPVFRTVYAALKTL